MKAKSQKQARDPGHVYVPAGTTDTGARRLVCACGVASTMEPEAHERCSLLLKKEGARP